MPTSPELPLPRTHDRTLSRQVFALLHGCRVELLALIVALALTWILGTSLVAEMRAWDANGVVLLIGALWMALCVVLYRLLDRVSR